jgi:glutamyl-tRNA synthetase
MPAIAHLSVILSPSGRGKLSKRDQAFQDGDSYVLVKTLDYAKEGFLPEATVNWLANIGWNFGDDIEIFNIQDAIGRFAIPDMNPAPTKLPFSKLEWINGQYFQAMEPLELAKLVKPYLDGAGIEVNIDALIALMPAMRVRMKRLPDALSFLQFLDDAIWDPETARLTHKKLDRAAAIGAFLATREYVAAGQYDLDSLGEKLYAIGEQYSDNGKAGPFLGTLRYAVTGQQVSPPLFESMMALGKARTLTRLDAILARLQLD